MKNTIEELETKMEKIRESITKIGHIHPGTLSTQTRSYGGEYHQLSFTHAGKGHTLYVRPNNVDEVREAVTNYKHLRELVNQWLDLGIEYAKIRRDESKQTGGKQSKEKNKATG